ncbi:MAG: gfo/Idh/MocA family oxidoreductase [Bdellovibrio sp. CG10_big_fil_rev_8_21_14_0_10_47_8]|nr:MAG: gfo/Idh/MocA family oxidoreductase [Bdellovibrio sp. CG10_big_fil_rev_8_21_14_0_10_47_8]
MALKTRAAVVGVGYLGSFHAQKYKALSARPDMNVELVGVCDLHFPQAQKIGADLGVQAYSRPEDLLGKVDAVTIATITPTHYELTKFFLSNGIHVNVEKPICLFKSEAEDLVKIAKEKGLVLCVGHSERFNPVFRELRGSIHQPRYLEFNRYAPFKLRGSDVSVLHDLMIHDLDLMLSMNSTSVRLVSAQAGKMVTKTYDWCSASFEFESGVHCQINCSRLSKEMTRSIRVVDEKNIWIGNLQTGELEKTMAVDHPENPVHHETKNIGRGDNLLSETEAFLLEIQGKKAGAVHGIDAMRALDLVETIIGSIESQRGS